MKKLIFWSWTSTIAGWPLIKHYQSPLICCLVLVHVTWSLLLCQLANCGSNRWSQQESFGIQIFDLCNNLNKNVSLEAMHCGNGHGIFSGLQMYDDCTVILWITAIALPQQQDHLEAKQSDSIIRLARRYQSEQLQLESGWESVLSCWQWQWHCHSSHTPSPFWSKTMWL